MPKTQTITLTSVALCSDGPLRGNAMLTYQPTIDETFRPVVILDASGAPGCRRIYDDQVKKRRMARIKPYVPKRYPKFKIDIWNRGGGKHQFRNDLDELLEGICEWIVRTPFGEPVLVIHHVPDTDTQVAKLQKKLRRTNVPCLLDLSEELPKYLEEHYPFFDNPIAFTTWGLHRARNDWKDFPNVVAAGTLFKPDSVYEAQMRIAQSYPPELGIVDRNELAEFKLGEYGDDLVQGLGRVKIRGIDPDDHDCAPAARALVVAHESQIPMTCYGVWFPGAQVREVVLGSASFLDGQRPTSEFVTDWRNRKTFGDLLTRKELREALGMDAKTLNEKVLRNVTLEKRLRTLDMVPYIVPGKKRSDGWQVTSRVNATQKELHRERNQ